MHAICFIKAQISRSNFLKRKIFRDTLQQKKFKGAFLFSLIVPLYEVLFTLLVFNYLHCQDAINR